MKIVVVGAGYVGLVSGACFAELGNEVCIVDNDKARIAKLYKSELPIFEPGLDRLVAENLVAGRLSFQSDLAAALHGAQAVFLAVGTPSRRGDGHADLSYIFAAAEEIARAARCRMVLVTKSTVPVGTGRRIQDLMARIRPDIAIAVASNPEFLREGNAISDFMRPDRVVIGSDDPEAIEVLRALYYPLSLNETPVVSVGMEAAELIKYASNAFLAAKVTFINQVADLCEACGADVHEVAHGMGLDQRIGRRFLNAGPGYGGSCFPKDTLALARTARDFGTPMSLVEATIASNEARKTDMTDRILSAMEGKGSRRVGVLGLAFKPDTDDMRDAPALTIIPRLIEAGCQVRAFDPVAMDNARLMLPADVTFVPSSLEAASAAEALVVLTEWNEFRALSAARLREAMHGNVIIDLRNIWDPAVMREAGFDYSSVGRR